MGATLTERQYLGYENVTAQLYLYSPWMSQRSNRMLNLLRHCDGIVSSKNAESNTCMKLAGRNYDLREQEKQQKMLNYVWTSALEWPYLAAMWSTPEVLVSPISWHPLSWDPCSRYKPMRCAAFPSQNSPPTHMSPCCPLAKIMFFLFFLHFEQTAYYYE